MEYETETFKQLGLAIESDSSFRERLSTVILEHWKIPREEATDWWLLNDVHGESQLTVGNHDQETKEAILRFYKFVDVLPNGCHFWTGARSRGKGNKKWYGSFKYKGQAIRAHRFACDVIGGKVCPPGWHRDHSCVFSLCVNPEHINPMPREQNQEHKIARRCDFVTGYFTDQFAAGYNPFKLPVGKCSTV